jgi:hypothetical protein
LVRVRGAGASSVAGDGFLVFEKQENPKQKFTRA